MTKQTIGSIIVGLMTLNPAVPAQAFQGGKQGGMGFTGAPGGGFTGPRGGGFTETLGGYSGANQGSGFNRGSSSSMRGAFGPFLSGGVRGNAKRFKSADNLNRANTINNANVNRIGAGWNNPYMRSHMGWIHGYWNGLYPGGLGWRRIGDGDPGFDGAGFDGRLGYGLGMGLGLAGRGLTPWIYGPMLYNYGYSNYRNPYDGGGVGGNTLVAHQPEVSDYSQPINAQGTPPARAVTDQAKSTFDEARQAFKGGNGPRALELVDRALQSTPDDPTLHEFRALTLFALNRYDEAAPALYAVLSVEPGWDWTTLITLYGDPATYTQQLLALEGFTLQNPQSAPAHFVLAYHYLTEEYADAAVRQFKLVTARQPKDALSAELIQQLEHPRQRVAATGLTQPERPAAPAPPVQTVVEAPPAGKKGKIEGTWTAQPCDDMNIGVAFQEGGRFTWKVRRQGKYQQFQGKSRNENGILTLVQDQSNNTIVGYLRWTDQTHFVFRVMGAGSSDPGLSFTKSS